MGKLILMSIFAVAAAPVVVMGIVFGAAASAAVKVWENFKGAD